MEMLDLVIIACTAPPPSTLSHISLVAVLFVTEPAQVRTVSIKSRSWIYFSECMCACVIVYICITCVSLACSVHVVCVCSYLLPSCAYCVIVHGHLSYNSIYLFLC